MSETDIDVVGYWTELKLNILKEYSQAYAKILSKHSYIKQALLSFLWVSFSSGEALQPHLKRLF
ncbi:MAG: hypothetical protein A2X93_09300 [Deltaproteobacteria bacterium GWC2_56_8]|nr:MAG: hypothetical protein A2X99_11670 [Deltaproteobacteria bacterium GWB2_55_19]OGP34648.1 MAG: hypothetical protein A2X93_09300 [Deltaproteobacteria bacterium GWC2_56_8]